MRASGFLNHFDSKICDVTDPIQKICKRGVRVFWIFFLTKISLFIFIFVVFVLDLKKIHFAKKIIFSLKMKIYFK